MLKLITEGVITGREWANFTPSSIRTYEYSSSPHFSGTRTARTRADLMLTHGRKK